MSHPQRKDAPLVVDFADDRAATIPPPDTRRSYS